MKNKCMEVINCGRRKSSKDRIMRNSLNLIFLPPPLSSFSFMSLCRNLWTQGMVSRGKVVSERPNYQAT